MTCRKTKLAHSKRAIKYSSNASSSITQVANLTLSCDFGKPIFNFQLNLKFFELESLIAFSGKIVIKEKCLKKRIHKLTDRFVIKVRSCNVFRFYIFNYLHKNSECYENVNAF